MPVRSVFVAAAFALGCSSSVEGGAPGAPPGATAASLPPTTVGAPGQAPRSTIVGQGADQAKPTAPQPPPGAQQGSTILGPGGPPGQQGSTILGQGPAAGSPPPPPSPAAAHATPGQCAFWGEVCQNCVGQNCLKETYACTGDAACTDARRAASSCLCTAQNAGGSTSACLATEAHAGPVASALTSCVSARCVAACGFK